MITGAMLFAGCATQSPQYSAMPQYPSPAYTPSPARTPTPSTPRPAQEPPHEGILLIQCILNSIGYRAGPENGIPTREFLTAWADWLRSHRLSTDDDDERTAHILLQDYANRVAPVNRRCVPKDDSPTTTARPEPTDRHVTGTGYRNMRWGEGMDSVRQKTGGRYHPLGDRTDRIEFSDQAFGLKCVAGAYFHRDQLFMVMLTSRIPSGLGIPRQVADLMTREFGPASHMEKSEHEITLFWLLPNGGMVRLNYDATQVAAGKSEYPILQLVWEAPDGYGPPSVRAESPRKSQPPSPNVAARTKRPYSI
jgi:hypothetical protein